MEAQADGGPDGDIVGRQTLCPALPDARREPDEGQEPEPDRQAEGREIDDQIAQRALALADPVDGRLDRLDRLGQDVPDQEQDHPGGAGRQERLLLR